MPMSKTGLQQTAGNCSDAGLREFKLTMLMLGWKFSEVSGSIEFYKGNELLKYGTETNSWKSGILYWPEDTKGIARPFKTIDKFLEFYRDL